VCVTEVRPRHGISPGSIALVALGGVVGTAGRYGLALAVPTPTGGWPWATFAVNLVGAFVLGALLEALTRSGADVAVRRRIRLLIGTGFCGSLTTYSTFAVEIDLLVRAHEPVTAFAYLAVSLVAGIAVTAAGIAVATNHGRYRDGAT
jgi:fluoride exporter